MRCCRATTRFQSRAQLDVASAAPDDTGRRPDCGDYKALGRIPMSVPNHKAGCTTAMWQTSCPDCHKPVWFFSCSCGSKVFFQSKGAPWNPHEEWCIPYQIRTLIRQGHSGTSIRNLVTEHARKNGQEVPAHIFEKILEEDFEKKQREVAVRVEPQDDDHILTGRVLDANLEVNFFRRMKFPDAPLSRALLKNYVDKRYVEIRVREKPDEVSGLCAELQCFVEERDYRGLKLHVGSEIIVAVSPQEMPNHTRFWFVSRIEARKK